MHDQLWTALLDVLILLLAAAVLGTICEKLRQSSIVGFLIAGALLGPHVFNVMPNHEAIASIAELGVTLLLFTIGLEFSFRRLIRLGAMAAVGGTLQIVLTALVAIGLALLSNRPVAAAFAIGAVVSLSSTAVVLRLLVRRTELESTFGRASLAILLLQDVAVAPLVLLIGVLARGGTAVDIGWDLGQAALGAVLLGVGLHFLLRYVVQPVLGSGVGSERREVALVIAVIIGLGAGWASVKAGLSPALGAFVAGVLLAESPFATQIRGDVLSLRTLFLTLFFGSIGMVAEPGWILHHWPLVLLVTVAIVIIKAGIITLIGRLLRLPWVQSLAAGLCLAQIGEFSFVLLDVAHEGALIAPFTFKLLISSTLLTLILTPYLIRLASWLSHRTAASQGTRVADHDKHGAVRPDGRSALVVGYGPAGRQLARVLNDREIQVTIIEQSSASAAQARNDGYNVIQGSANQGVVLEHVRLDAADSAFVTVPDPTTAQQIITLIRSLAPHVTIVARGRYKLFAEDLRRAGADLVVDEETETGRLMAEALS